MTQAALPLARRRPAPTRAAGVACIVASASFFACNTNLARLTFESGMDALTLNAMRFLFAILFLLAVTALRPRAGRLTPRQRLAASGLGLLFFLVSFGYIGAVQYLPVSVAVLLLYSYPILVGLIARVTEREPLGAARVLALLLAFGGLALALGLDTSALPDWRGVALALTGALAMALLVVTSSRLLREADYAAVNLHLIATGTVLFVAMLLIEGTPRWPSGTVGWLALAGALVTFALAQITLIAGLGAAGPVLSALLMNLEPLLTVSLAVLVMGERLTAPQLVGAGLVLAALLLASRGPRIRMPPAEP